MELCKGRRLPPTPNFRGVIRLPPLPRLLFAKNTTGVTLVYSKYYVCVCPLAAHHLYLYFGDQTGGEMSAVLLRAAMPRRGDRGSYYTSVVQ